jgi:broad specificity phosphatase PhoE
MIRHGAPTSRWGHDSADPDPGLDAAGQGQAEAAADRLMALSPDLRPVRVFSSPLRRCRETAQPFAERIGALVEIDARFGEIPSPSALSPERRGSWLRAAFAGCWADIEGDVDYEVWRRSVAGALAEQAQAAVFSHFVAINAALSCATGADRVLEFSPDYASMTVFDADRGRLTLIERGPEAPSRIL